MNSIDASSPNYEIISSLYLTYSDELLAFLRGLLRDRDLAQEALQATFAEALESVHQSREETRKGWLFRVAYHQAMQLRRKSARYQEILGEAAWHHPPSPDTGTPHESLARWETVNEVRKSLQELPPEQAEIVRLRIYEELTFKQIAQQLGLPLGTVLTRMRLALKSLTRHLSKHD